MLCATLRVAARRGRAAASVAAAATLPASPALLSPFSRPLTSTSGTAAPSPRRLGDILHLDKLTGCSGPEIEAIWVDFHAVKAKADASTSAFSASPSPAHAFRLGSTLAAADYATFKERAKASPMLALPIAKETAPDGEGQGKQPPLLTLLSQAQLPHLLVGTLEEYRQSGPAAPAHAIITHYDELAADKGVVLVRTDLVSPHVLTPSEARALVSTLHSLYLNDAGHALVRAFNHDPSAFDWGELCRHLGVEAE